MFNGLVRLLSNAALTVIQNGVDINIKIQLNFGQWSLESLVSINIVEILEILVGKILIVGSVFDKSGVVYNIDRSVEKVFSKADLADISRAVLKVVFTYIHSC